MGSLKKFFRECDLCHTALCCKKGHHNSQEALKCAKGKGWIRASARTGWQDHCTKCKDSP